MLDYSREELQRLTFLDICIDESRDECRKPLHELREGARVHYEIETQYQRKDGASLPVQTYFSAVSGFAPTQLTFLVVTVDIAARRAAEDALRAAQAELARVARLTTVGAMAASIAHEINQPRLLAALIPRPARFAVVEPRRHHNARHNRTAACLRARVGQCVCQRTSGRYTCTTGR